MATLWFSEGVCDAGKNNPIFSCYCFRDISYFPVVLANNETVKHTIDLKSKLFSAIKLLKKKTIQSPWNGPPLAKQKAGDYASVINLKSVEKKFTIYHSLIKK